MRVHYAYRHKGAAYTKLLKNRKAEKISGVGRGCSYIGRRRIVQLGIMNSENRRLSSSSGRHSIKHQVLYFYCLLFMNISLAAFFFHKSIIKQALAQFLHRKALDADDKKKKYGERFFHLDANIKKTDLLKKSMMSIDLYDDEKLTMKRL
jgi:hypothetical protein